MNEETIVLLVLALALLGLGFMVGSYLRGLFLEKKKDAELEQELAENRRRLEYMQ